MSLQAKNKELIKAFAEEVYKGDNYDDETLKKYIGDKYIEHNPDLPDGREALKGLKGLIEVMDLKRIAAEDDLVWLHSRFILAGKEVAVVDIYRVENGKIVEHWDVIQDMPEAGKSQNDHPMF